MKEKRIVKTDSGIVEHLAWKKCLDCRTSFSVKSKNKNRCDSCRDKRKELKLKEATKRNNALVRGEGINDFNPRFKKELAVFGPPKEYQPGDSVLPRNLSQKHFSRLNPEMRIHYAFSY